jgi:3-hydroxyisobutyrate dehydrogenase-like beta-hydroxyacid dehydrogenase
MSASPPGGAERATVGLLGLGNMGAAIAHRLVREMAVVGFDPDSARCQVATEAGVEVVGSLEDVAAAAGVVVLSLPRPSISLDAVRRLTATWHEPGVVVETSTVTPADAREAAALCAASGSSYADAAILSGVKSVMDGQTTLLVGGSSATLDRVQHVLDAISSSQKHLGDVGAGMAAKVINNAVAHAVYVVLSEAVALGKANGIEVPTIVDMLSDSEGGLIRPLTHRIGERLAAGDFEGGMPVDAARKDSELVLQVAQAAKVPLFAMMASHTVYELAMAEGLGRADYAAIATLWDRWAGR